MLKFCETFQLEEIAFQRRGLFSEAVPGAAPPTAFVPGFLLPRPRALLGERLPATYLGAYTCHTQSPEHL